MTRAEQVALLTAYAATLCELARESRDDLSTIVDELLAARAAAEPAVERCSSLLGRAEAALARCRCASDLAARYSAFAARAAAGDVIGGDLRAATDAIAELTGIRAARTA